MGEPFLTPDLPIADHGRDDDDASMVAVLEDLVARNETITARAVARHHPSIKAASSITRSESRKSLLAKYQEQQRQFRGWQGRISKQSKHKTAEALSKKDLRIVELERQVAQLTASHIAMIRAVGETGGFTKWVQFFHNFSEIRDQLAASHALPSQDPDGPSVNTEKGKRKPLRKSSNRKNRT
ncbi:MAG: hypothetical protein ACLQAT_06885 [Candidatus Binataceae bacterium]